MKTMAQWLGEYGESHRHPANKAIHWVCVPLILFSVLALLWVAPVPADLPPWVNWATVLMAGAIVYYLLLSPPLAAGMAVIAVALFAVIAWLDRAGFAPLWAIALGVFVGAWVGQFIGHEIERKKPSFFKDLQFLLIGPAWLLADLYRRLGLKF